MKIAIEEAKKIKEDIPVCAIVVKNDEIISIGKNEREKNNQASSHAEIIAINEANKKLNSWRLEGCDIYVTLEPCPMCAWALINSRIDNVYFGSFDLKYGAFGSAINLLNLTSSKINVLGGILEEECNEVLNDYFRELRNEKTTR